MGSKEVAGLNKELLEASELRAGEKAQNLKTIADAGSGKAAVDQATGLLKKFYGGALLQASAAPKKTVDDLAPKTFSSSDEYKGKSDASKACADPDRVVHSKGELSQFTLVLKALLPFAPTAACGTLGLVTGNSAYRYSSVSFLQMVKESHIMFVYILMLVVGLDKFKIRMAIVIGFVAVCAMVAVFGEVRFSWFGLSLQLVAGLAGSGQIVLARECL